MLGQHVDKGVDEPTSAFLVNKQTVLIMLIKVSANKLGSRVCHQHRALLFIQELQPVVG